MNRRALLSGAAALAFAGALRPAGAAWGSIAPMPPVTPRHPLRIEQLGRTRVDDYAWLKPLNWKEVWRDPATLDPLIRAELAREEAYSDAVLRDSEPVRARLAARMRQLTAVAPEPPPEIDGDWAYCTQRAPGARYPRYLRRPRAGGPAQLLLDGEARAAGSAFLSIVNPTHSPDGRLFAWAEDRTGAEKYTIVLRDPATGGLIEGPHDAFGTFAFSADGAWLFWTWRDPNSRPARVYRRPARGGPDTLVYVEEDPAFLLEVTLGRSGRYLVLRSWNDVTSEVRLIDARRPQAPPRLVAPRRTGHLYTLEHWNDRFVVLTNADGAVDFKLMQAPEAQPERRFWRDWVPEQRGRTLTEVRAFRRFLVRVERDEGNPVPIVRAWGSDADRPVRFDEPAYALTWRPSAYEGEALTIGYESPKTPRTWMSVALGAARPAPVSAETPGAFDRERFQVLRLHAAAADGADVPITLLCRRDTPRDRSAPLLLTGYGAYGYSVETGFSAPNLALVEQGWIWAVAHVRGGSEKGREWFEAARQLHKKVSFTDFIACAEHLIAAGYTRPQRIVTHGFSAGGLLVGAALNMRPDLWGATIGEAPFVDMLNTMSDATHPLVPLTRPVWGDPLADPAAYDYIASYSPYENVAARPYPPVLAATAISDDRVGFWEPAKWIAKLRARSTSGAPMLLHVDLTGGHTGGSAADGELDRSALLYAFAINTLNARAAP